MQIARSQLFSLNRFLDLSKAGQTVKPNIKDTWKHYNNIKVNKSLNT